MGAERIAGVAFVALAAGVAGGAYQFYVPYQYEPLGPAVFPYLVAVSLGVAGGFLFFKPDSATMGIGARHLVALVTLVSYGYLLEPLGYPVTTTIVVAGLGVLLGLRIGRAALMALVMTLVTYVVLAGVLGLNLPIGWVWLSGLASG